MCIPYHQSSTSLTWWPFMALCQYLKGLPKDLILLVGNKNLEWDS